MSRTVNLNAFLYFESVARRGTITRAAEELCVSPSAVSQQIKLLEQQLGVKLFRRDGRAVRLTFEGNQLFQTSSSAIRALLEAQRDLGRVHEPLRLNLRVTPSFGVRWLGPRLADFLDKHPTLELHVDAAPDPSDFDRETIELDIRYGIGMWPGYHAQPILSDHILPLCSPDYFRQLKGNTAQEMIDKARLIDSARAICRWDDWCKQSKLPVSPKSQSILMDRSSMAIQLALDGAGIVLESLALTAQEVAEGRLVPVFPDLPVLRFPAYWAICPARNLQRRPVRSFLGWVEQQVVDHNADVEAIVSRHSLKVTDLDLASG
ncbi:LysR substrate-binding domain-containing protein [Marivivens sp. LCG002]|uniref:LysR substrate-binding domain-containing protein n=1 Tax=Marivivens sp. LCG002 TaxID=3051171 RepID=UPI0025536AB8|nr:LysR substrate-binding domain-containing protein [Marivivens sp. LCG002]WIV50409.1 LysR substrate-binding domain-containing protein [Marivivens sp. LCG002]